MTAKRSRRPAPVLLPLGAGLVGALSCPPVDVAPAILVGLLGLAVALDRAPSWTAAARGGFAWAFAGQLVVLQFVVPTVDRFTGLGVPGGLLALVLLAAAQSLGWAAAGAACHVLVRRGGVPLPAAFALSVLIACAVPGVFAWTPAGLLSGRPELLQAAEWIGERGVSALLALLVGSAALAWRRHGPDSGAPQPGTSDPTEPRGEAPAPARRLTALRPARPTLLVAALVVLVLVDRVGAARMDAVARAQDGVALRVGLVDQAAAARTAATEPTAVVLRRLESLSTRAERAGARLVVWPEAAYRTPLPRGTRRIEGGTVAPITSRARVPRLIGLQTDEPSGARSYNSATLVTPDGTVQPPYDKLALLPFGETVPGPLRPLFPNASRTTAGRTARPLVLPAAAAPPGVGAVRLGVLICYEDMNPGVGRRVGRLRPRLLVNVTNDAWFAGTSAPALQARLAAVRTVELRTAMVRAVNGGASAWIDATGRLRRRQDGAGPSVLVAHPVLREAGARPTFYVRAGDAPAWAAGLLVIVLAGGRRRFGERARSGASPGR
jgi:apolipoprotein N-acyltransferase